MKISYNREQDILMYEVSDEPIDYAEEVGPIIVHFSKEGKNCTYGDTGCERIHGRNNQSNDEIHE
ncbi:MAG: DUF2283 domain-containing protein [Candidatus Methanoperedens sp.]|nr:DUF2283 domain-containing protein [Candidatus Methanoperedens sp.]